MIGGRTRAAVALAHRPQIQSLDNLHHKARQVLFRRPLINRGRHQEPGLTVGRKLLINAVRTACESTLRFKYGYPRGAKSDKLLEESSVELS